MQWLEKARAILPSTNGLSLPDPDRIDVGSVPNTVRLIEAIDAAMPRTAIVQLIGPRHEAMLPVLAAHSIPTRSSTGEYFISLENGALAALARAAAGCAPNEVCSHLLVQDGEHTLLEAFGRDRGEDVVWISSRLPRARLRRFLEAISGTAAPTNSIKEGEAMFPIARRALAMLAAFGLVALTLLACVQPPALVIETSTGDVVPLETWTATLSSSSTALRGTATLSPGGTYRETLATVSLTGAAPRSVHAWYIQLGECGHDLGILAGPQSYAPIGANEQGEGRSTVTLPFTVPTSGRYFVSVRQADSDSSPTVACGNLTKDRSVGGPTIANGSAR